MSLPVEEKSSDLGITVTRQNLSNILLVTLMIQKKRVEELNNTEFCEVTPRPVSPYLLIIKFRLEASPGPGNLNHCGPYSPQRARGMGLPHST